MLDMIAVERTDFMFSLNGDFRLKHGDLETTAHLAGLGFIEEVEVRIKSSPRDWYFDSRKGAGLEEYEGRMITPGLLQNIKESISNSLTYDDFLTINNFNVEVGVIDLNEVAVKVIFSDNIRRYVDYKIQDVRIVFDLQNGTPKIVRM